MAVFTEYIDIESKADGKMNNLTDDVEKIVKSSNIENGCVIIFCSGSTASISTIEFEPGLKKDIPIAMDKIAPKDIDYHHHKTWNDDNGRSHVKSTIMGTSLTVPIVKKELTLGRWQQIVFIEWDTQDRERKIVVQVMGE